MAGGLLSGICLVVIYNCRFICINQLFFMSTLDWLVLLGTLGFIVLYGMWKSRHTTTLSTYLLADRQLPWYHVGLSVMATQASAITFLSAPGQGYSDGLRFIQFYFGLPLAMIFLCVFFIPVFHKLNVFTAYEYLEQRFDRRTRKFTALLFLLQRGLSTGVTIYAPAIILSSILDVQLTYTILFNGVLVIIYTLYGGTKAVSYTQVLQMSVIFGGLIITAILLLRLLPEGIGFTDALHIAGKSGRLKAVDTTFDVNDRYNLWSGIIGGFFLQLSYFGTDQSQVGRYLTGSSVKQSRLGLIMNAMLKIPMQFLILLIGVLMFAFYQFAPTPLFFNEGAISDVKRVAADSILLYQQQQDEIQQQKRTYSFGLVEAIRNNDEQKQLETGYRLQQVDSSAKQIHQQVAGLIKRQSPESDHNDSNYIFLYFITHRLPKGIVGLLIAIIFLAAMGSTASGMNSLASATYIDLVRDKRSHSASDHSQLKTSRALTLGWGIFCIIVAFFASALGNLIEAVNILGSLFYGTLLGIFMVAFFLPKISAKPTFYAAIITECFIIVAWWFNLTAFLWLNVIGCLLLMILALLLQFIFKQPTQKRIDPAHLS